MAKSAKQLPTFAGQNKLSLEDVQALADVLAAQGLTVDSVPAGVHRGRKQYALANYTSSTVDFLDPDENNDGVIRSVDYSPYAEFPYIFDGEIVHPYAQDFYTEMEDGTLEETEVPGVLQRVEARAGLRRSCIVDGALQLALACSEFESDSSISVPGLLWGVEYDSSVSAPRLSEGLLLLPPPGGGACPPAEYEPSGVSVLGSVHSIVLGSSVSAPCIHSGSIKIPPADDGTGEHAPAYGLMRSARWHEAEMTDSSVSLIASVHPPCVRQGELVLPVGVLGFIDIEGNRVALRDCYTNGAQQTTLASFALYGENLRLCVNYRDGFLQFFFVYM